MRRYLYQPLGVNFDQTSHKFLRCQDEFVINDPFWKGFEHAGAGMTMDCVGVLECSVVATLLQFCCVVEESGSNGFPDICEDIIAHGR